MLVTFSLNDNNTSMRTNANNVICKNDQNKIMQNNNEGLLLHLPFKRKFLQWKFLAFVSLMGPQVFANTKGTHNPEYSITNFYEKGINGVVKDGKGQPLQGVSVKIKGTSVGTSTGADGSFSINA